MKITKFGHCCLVIEENDLRILTDPGAWTTQQNNVKNIDLILITHEHQDHLHVGSVKQIMTNNPQAVIVTNSSVGKLLDREGIKYQVVSDKQNTQFKNMLIEGFGTKHAIIYEDLGQVENTGYFVNNKLFYPGDALTNPGRAVDILAMPAAGPWIKASEAIDYAKTIKPRVCFPVHDAVLSSLASFYYFIYETFLAKAGIKFVNIEINKETEL